MNGPTTASAGCRRSRFCRGQHRPESLLSKCLLDGGAYAAFGDPAVPVLTEAIQHGHLEEAGGALLTLEILMAGRPSNNIQAASLSPRSRNQILEMARQLLQPGRMSWGLLGPMARIALLTGDRDLRQKVELLDKNPGIASGYGADTQQKIDLAHVQVHRALEQYGR